LLQAELLGFLVAVQGEFNCFLENQLPFTIQLLL